MPDSAPTVDFAQLESDYTIVGELGSTASCRTFTGERKTGDSKRKDDHPGVLIAVHNTPEGDESNALSHLAADTKILANEGHRRLVPVIDGRWIDDDHFAVISQRLADPTLAQRLAAREEFSTIRIAALLRELNGLLEWAREQGIVNRLISGTGVYLEPRTDRVRVTFDIAPLHRVRPTEETRDARTIARLAMAMLAGVEDPDTCTVEMLMERRPELPKRLSEATAELLEVKNASTKTDIVNFIALIGMSDPLYRGEEEEKRIRAEILEEQKAEREKLATERADFEAAMTKERTDFNALSTKERSDFQAASTKERSDFGSFMEKEKAKLEAERQSLQKQVADERAKLQKAVTQERSDLTAKRAEIEKAIAAQKAELERVASQDRKKLEELRAELKKRGEAEIERKRQVALEEVEDASASELDNEELASPKYEGPKLPPIPEFKFNDDSPVFENEPLVFEPKHGESAKAPERLVTGEGVAIEAATPQKPSRWRPYLIPGSIGAGVAALALIVALAMNQRAGSTKKAPTTAAKRPVAAQVAAVATYTTAGPPGLPQSIVPLPVRQRIDSAGGSIAPRVDSMRPSRTAAAPMSNADSVDRDARARAAARAAAEERHLQAVSDSIFEMPPPARAADTTASRKDSVVAPKRDSTTPPDTTKKPN